MMYQISQYIMAYYLDFVQLWYISLTFGPSKSLSQDFGLFQNGSKFWNFGLGDGKIWKSPYCIYLVLTFATGPSDINI
jgi:hypothetical protein